MSTAFQPNAFQQDAFQQLGGLTTADVEVSVDYTNRPDLASIQINVAGSDVTGGWWPLPRRKKKKPEQEIVEAIEFVEEEPQTALADALRSAAAKAARQAQRGAEDALVQFVKELEAKRAADEAQRLANEAWLAELVRVEAEMRRRRDEEETALLFILTARKRRSRQPA